MSLNTITYGNIYGQGSVSTVDREKLLRGLRDIFLVGKKVF